MWGPILRGCAPGDSSGGPVVKTPCFQCRGHGFNPWLGNLRSQRPHGAREKKEKEQIMCSPWPLKDQFPGKGWMQADREV